MSDFPRIKIYPPGLDVELDGDALFLGRDCHLASLIPALLNKVVSNRHCVIRREGARWMLEDLGSTNGTWIRGARLAGKVPLHNGDQFSLGKNGPRVECVVGFGGAGPERTMREDEMPRAAAAPAVATEVADPYSVKTALLDGLPAAKGGTERERSALGPSRTGRAPTIRLVHKRHGEKLAASGYSIVIGRDPEAAQIVLRADDERHVSGRHVEIAVRSDGRVVVRDLGSRNGTWLNDKPLKSEAPLKVGDKLVLGNAPTVLVVTSIEK